MTLTSYQVNLSQIPVLPIEGGTGTSTIFTQGSVVFAGPSGVYTQDNSNFFWDNATNNLGLGLNSPSARLDILGGNSGVNGTGGYVVQIIGALGNSGTFGTTGDGVFINAGTGGTSTTFQGGQGGDLILNAGLGGDTTAGAGNIGGPGGSIILTTGNGGTAISDAGGVGGSYIVQGGQGGLGSTVQGGSGGQVTITSGSGGNGGTGDSFGGQGGLLTIAGGQGGQAVGDGDGGDGASIYIVPGASGIAPGAGSPGAVGNLFLVVDNTNTPQGFTGVGTNAPTQRLDVVGNVKFSGALMPNSLPGTSGQLLVSAGANNPPVWTNASTVVAANAWSLTGNAGTSAGTNFIGTTDNVSLLIKNNNVERLSFNAASAIWNDLGNDYDVRIEGDTEPNLFITDASTDRVGIGTATPDSRLHAIHTSSTSGNQMATHFRGLKTVANIDTYNAMQVDADWSAASGTQQAINAISVTSATTGAAGTLNSLKGVTAFVNNSAGKTIGDYRAFEVAAPINSGTLTTFNALYVNSLTAATNNFAIYTAGGGHIVINDAGTATADVRIEGDTDANLFFTNSVTDRVGIGTNGPGSKLDVAGSFQCDSITNDTGLAFGTYTPTLTNVANLAASTAYSCQYMRVGNTVTVSGKVDIDPTVTATLTRLGISLPIASNLGAQEQCAGTAVASGIASQSAAILGDATNDRAQLEYISTDITNQSMYFTFTYRVI